MNRIIVFFSLWLVITTACFSITIRVGIAENEPLVFKDSQGNIRGVFVDLLETVAHQEGWQLEYIYADWDDLMIMLSTAKIDILPDIAYTEERAKIFDYNKEVIFTNWGRVFSSTGFTPQSLFDLRDKRIAVMKGDVYFAGKDGFKDVATQLGLNCTFIEVADYRTVFAYVAQGKADAGVVNRIFGEYNLRSYSVQKTSIIFRPVNLHYGFPKNAALNKLIIDKLDTRLAAMKKDENSLYYRFIDNYFVEVKVVRKIPRWLPEIIISLVIIALFIHTMLMRYQVKRKTAELRNVNEELNRLAITDVLTGCNNRRFFMEELLKEIIRSRRYSTTLSLIILDIDFFKHINDKFGHLTGDLVLTRIGTILRSVTRENDCVARYGGEEFVVLLPETTLQKALSAAEKIRATLSNEPFTFGDETFTVSASFGVGSFDGSTVNEFIAQVDNALYAAKENRGSIVYCIHDSEGITRFTTFIREE